MQYSRNGWSEKSAGGFLFILATLVSAAFLGAMICLYAAASLGWLERPAAGAGQEETARPEQAALSREEQDARISAVWEKVAPAVVSVNNIATEYYLFDKKQEVVRGIGSGAIISADGYIVTNCHVIAGAEKIRVGLFDGRELEARVAGSDSRSDLAVLKIEASGLPYLAFADSDRIKVGQTALAIGNPGGNDFARSVTLGIISGVNRQLANSEGQQFRLLQTDAAINPGNSGGPLVNIRGELMGINSVKIATQSFEGMGFAIPSNLVREISALLIADGQITRPALGVEILADVTKKMALDNDLSVAYGVVISPLSGGPAAKAGLRRYDIIVAIDGDLITDSYILQEKVFSMAIGDTAKVTILRNNQEMTAAVRLSVLTDE